MNERPNPDAASQAARQVEAGTPANPSLNEGIETGPVETVLLTRIGPPSSVPPTARNLWLSYTTGGGGKERGEAGKAAAAAATTAGI